MTREDEAIKNLGEALERRRDIDRAIEATNEEVRVHGGTLPELPLEFLKARAEAVIDLFERDMEEERAEQNRAEKES